MSAYEMVARMLLLLWSPVVELARVLLVVLALIALLFWVSDLVAWIQLSREKHE